MGGSASWLAWLCVFELQLQPVLGFDTFCVGDVQYGNLFGCTTTRPSSIQSALMITSPGDTVLAWPGEYTGGINDDTTDTGAGRYSWWASAQPLQDQPTTAEEDSRNVNLRLSKSRSHVTLKSLSGPAKTIITCERLGLQPELPLHAVTHKRVTGCTSATRCPGAALSDDCSNEPDCAVRGNCAIGCVATTTAAPARIMDGFGIIAENGETYQTVIDGFTITRCGRTRNGRPGGGLRIVGGASDRSFPEQCSAIDAGNSQHVTFCGQYDLSGLDPEVDKAGCENAGGGNICQYYYGAGITVRNTWFVKNYGNRGAAIAVAQQGHVVLDRVVLRENVAEDDGGAIYADVGNFDGLVTNLVISDSLIVGNEAGERGGGISSNLAVDSCHVHISNSVIASNTAGETGGGLDDRFTTGSFRLWNTVVVDNAANVQQDSSQMFCGPNVHIMSDQTTTDCGQSNCCSITNPDTGVCEAWLACTKTIGRSEPLRLSTYTSELSLDGGTDSVVVGVDKMHLGLETQSPVQSGLPFSYGLPNQIWYLPPPAMESCTGPVAACENVGRSDPSVPFTEAQCTSASSSCVYTPNDFRDPVILTVSGTTLRPFRDMVEVLLLPKTTDSLDDMFDVECFTRLDGRDYRGLVSKTRTDVPCVAWDSPIAVTDGNTPESYPFAGLEDGAFCRNPNPTASFGYPWCYTATPVSGNMYESCQVGNPVGTCARDLAVMAKLTSNSSWDIFADYDQGMFIRLNLDEEFMTEGGFKLTLDYAESCTTAGCSGHGVCGQPEPRAPHVCTCDDGYLGVDCSTVAVQYTRVYGSNGRHQSLSAINLQTVLTISAPNDLVRVAAARYSGHGNYDIVLGNVNLTFAGAGPYDTIIDCQGLGRGFYVDSSTAAGAVSVAIESLTVTDCYANDDPVRGPLGGAAFVKHAVATFRNVLMRNNRADTQGGAIYGFRSAIRLEDTVVGPGNNASLGGGVALESTVLVVDRAFVYDNVGTNLNCFADGRVDYIRGFHWKKLGTSILELETCSCCNGCQQSVPPLDVTQVTFDRELQDNITLGELATKVVIQGTFLSYGDDSIATEVIIAGEKCKMRNVTSYMIVCSLVSPYEEGQNITIRRNDGQTAQFPSANATCEASSTAACAAVDASAATGQDDCRQVAKGACVYVPPEGSAPAECAATDASACNQAVGSESDCVAAGRCTFKDPDEFAVYPERGVNKTIEASPPLEPGQTSENNGRTKIILSLKSQPQANVEIPVVLLYSISDQEQLLAESIEADFVPAVVETPVVYFTPENWFEPAQVVVSGRDDQRELPIPHRFDVQIGPTRSIDINYKDREMFVESMSNKPFDCLKFGAYGYVPKQVGDSTVCVCDKGYEKDPVMLAEDITLSRMDDAVPCVQCSNGKYKTDVGNHECTLCPLSEKGDANYNKIDTANLMGQTSVDACVCREGFVYDDSASSNNTCLVCDELCLDKLSDRQNLKNFDPKDPSTWCIFCDASGVRLSTMTVRDGWWRSEVTSSHVYQCPSSTIVGATRHCLQHNIDSNASTAHTCLTGSHGVMCTACDAGYAKVYTSKGGCVDCNKPGQKALMASALLLLVAFMYWTVRVSINSADDEDRISTMLLKIMISFTVTNMEVMKFRSQWPASISSIFNFQAEVNSKTSFSVTDIVSFDCFFAGEPTETRVFTKLLFYLFLPLLSLILPAIGSGPRWLMLKSKSRGMHPKAPEYLAAQQKMEACKEWFFAGIVVILYQVYPSTVNTTAAMFNCRKFDFDQKLHLSMEETVVCEGEHYDHWSNVALGGLIGFGLGVPVVTLFLLWSLMGPILDDSGEPLLDASGQVCLKMDDHSINRKYGFLYGGFREPRIWWETVVGVRKLLFLLSATFLNSYNTPFRIGVAMLITVVFMVMHLVFEPYPDEFKEVSAMESLGMLTVFFTYAAVLLMEESLANVDRKDVGDGEFTSMEWLFFWFIIICNAVFMFLVASLAIWDIWRKSHRHIKEHGLKASLQHAKQHVREKTKVDQIAQVVASPREFKNLIIGGDQPLTSVAPGLQHRLRREREEARKRDNARLNWLRGFSGASATARAGRAIAAGPAEDQMDHTQQQAAVEVSREAIGRAATNRRHRAARARESRAAHDTEEVEQLRRELEEAKQELAKARKGNVANRFRLGLRETKISQLQMSGGRMPATNALEPINMDEIDQILAAERVGTEAKAEQATKENAKFEAERGKAARVDGHETDVHRKLSTGPDEEQGNDISPEAAPEAASEATPESHSRSNSEPEPAPSKPGPEPSTDASQMVGTKIFYGNENRVAAGKNAKQFLQAVQEVKNQGKKNSELADVINKAVQKDHSWFATMKSDASTSTGYPTPPPTGVPNMARSSSQAVYNAARQASSAQGTSGVQSETPVPDLDLEAVEAGLGINADETTPLSTAAINDQVDVWQRVNRDAEVHALKAKMLMLGRFSAATLATQPRGVNQAASPSSEA